MKNKILYAIAIFVMIILLGYLIQRCNKPTNEVIDSTYKPVTQATDVLVVNDSVKAIQQKILVTEDPKVIEKLQDSIQRLINRMGKIKPIISVQFRETILDTHQTGKLQDSLAGVIDELLSKSMDNRITEQQFLAYKKEVLLRKIPYKIENKYRYETGSIDYAGNIVSDTLIVESKPLVTIGEKRGFLKRPTYTLTVGNTNPLVTNSEASSIMYVPKRTLQLSVGPMALTDGKTVTGGLGVTFKKGIFSASIGYMLVNTKK